MQTVYMTVTVHGIGNLNGRAYMATGKVPASKAGKELRSNKSNRDEKTVAGSDLAQAKHRKPPKKR